MTPPCSIDVLLFAGASESAGGADRVTVQTHPRPTANELMTQLAEQHTELAAMVQRSRLAVDQRYVSPDHVIETDAEVALIPPVSGG
ncbi:Molybdenum cofactor biosynthesis protein MoaD [Rhodopirellula islandica]|uniref:Molybdopterin synthase sulfur carrier subunit n=1 Tax=Rhodopirellula islandica TaxID=595434 RepID=A0A0J1BKE3_RHOIS|nr:MoaD/ThiS family protein [Rhodopirellula islandica]KLU07001.1 Molybdenum cofactor biosynthesis protein MoaD [Rhodopirellula islandica]